MGGREWGGGGFEDFGRITWFQGKRRGNQSLLSKCSVRDEPEKIDRQLTSNEGKGEGGGGGWVCHENI